jgi:hypothetical protein
MTEYNVSLTSSEYSISLDTQSSLTVSSVSIGATAVPAKFSDLSDFNGDSVSDKYVIMYNSSTQTYEAVNPDEIFTAAVNETSSPGISTVFLNQLGSDLDNQIDVDAGTF